MSDIFYEALQAHGIPAPKEDVTSGRVIRWGHNKRYWAVRFEGGYSFGDFVDGQKWEAFENNCDREKCKKEIREIQKRVQEEKSAEQEKVAVEVRKIWENATTCETHLYLEKKQIKSYGLKIQNDNLLIPLLNEDGNVVSLQKIFFDRKQNKFIKMFYTGARTKGCFCILGNIDRETIICEGYATGASIHECVKKPVVVAFSSGNLYDVAKTIRKKYPNAKITIAADNDKFKTGNPGITKAKDAARAINAQIAIPEFEKESENLTDFNDLRVFEGAEKVCEIFEKTNKEKSENVGNTAKKGEKAENTP
jgi:putative DNA primase/helicase